MSSATSRFSATSPISSVQEKVSATQRAKPAGSLTVTLTWQVIEVPGLEKVTRARPGLLA